MKRQVDYSFANLDKGVVSRLLEERGLTGNFMMLPFLGCGTNIKTINFQSKTSEKAIVRHNGKDYFIKKLPWYITREDHLLFIYKNYALFSQNNFPCPSIVKTLSDQSFSVYEGNFYVCFKYVDGHEFNHSPSQAYAFGKQLAIMHNLTLGQAANSFTENIFESFDQLAKISELPGIRPIKEYAALQFARIEGYDQYVCVVHGDTNPSNVIFDYKNNVKSLVDFDNLKYDNPIRDIAEATLAFGIVTYKSNTSNFDNIFNQPDQRVCGALLKGYGAHTSDPKMFTRLQEFLPSAVRVIASEFYLLSFLKKNALINDQFTAPELELDFLTE